MKIFLLRGDEQTSIDVSGSAPASTGGHIDYSRMKMCLWCRCVERGGQFVIGSTLVRIVSCSEPILQMERRFVTVFKCRWLWFIVLIGSTALHDGDAEIDLLVF
jgi:hypothetical protein